MRESSGIVVIIVDLLKNNSRTSTDGRTTTLISCFVFIKKKIFPPYFLRNRTFAFISKTKKKRQNRNGLKGGAFVYKTIENG